MTKEEKNTLYDIILKKSEEVSQEMRDECDGSYVGCEDNFEIEFNSNKYKVNVIAFWEKSEHMDISVKGKDAPEFEICLDF